MPHALAIGKAGLGGDDLDRVTGLLDHDAGRLDAQIFHRLGRRLAGLGAKGAAELARTEVRGLRQVRDVQGRLEISLGVVER